MQFAPQHFANAAHVVLPWTLTLTYGDIVSFRFPTDDAAKPKARPCLVLDIVRKRGRRCAVLAYGTSSRCTHDAGQEVQLLNREEAALAGLERPTRFVGARRTARDCPCHTSNGFVCCPELTTSVLGCVAGAEYAQVLSIQSRLQIEAAEARQASLSNEQ
ncbi:hypothetical protein [Tabrizicola sp.]|uniref:hypothetical protein n=1 Tax=Tabrizicola sp. TaxID=2005166 RepID=UPI0035B19E5B